MLGLYESWVRGHHSPGTLAEKIRQRPVAVHPGLLHGIREICISDEASVNSYVRGGGGELLGGRSCEPLGSP